MTTIHWRKAIRLVALASLIAPMIAACSGGGLGATVKRSAFTSSEFGVSSSPRVTSHPNPPKGGGRYQVGKPYTVRGKVYTPAEQPGYVATGGASWYGSDFHGRRTANGEIFSANAITGAHPTLPLPSYVRVTNEANGRSVIVRVNDRGPYMSGRIMDLSYRAATMLGYVNAGSTQIKAEYVGPAPLEGDDTRQLVASYSGPAYQSETQFAYNDGTNSLADMAGNFFGSIFSYADTTPEQADANIGTAFAAVNAVGTASPDLEDWAQSMSADARTVDITLGSFASYDNAVAMSEQFAILGAVSEEPVTVNGRNETQLSLTWLKPGVSRNDVVEMARGLGLNDIRLN
ncbi:MAG: septal ring lytic transglycosylase RlpA family protein [Candidatus Devosia phytovorans]|uniref:Endolytic peptidoglycan transglycosylase RlpA n=1 Tax=Candidatus Devosia phytovorans TaxID=3121372 RepID=A0AAJ5VYY4_9HYPH|nr:septal ring lytic transglycosylase RlpA family protein [Devosia sp.]WEK06002.1 MAG: septal ring lytic transglycosylase RlpA family protein [Devosia sp.]